MKKIIAMVAALATVSSFAGMITFDYTDYIGGGDHSQGSGFSPKFSRDVTGAASDDTTELNIQLNYAHSLGNGAQIQGIFGRYSLDNGTNDGNIMTLGVGYIHNFSSDVANTFYAAGRYMMTSCSDDDGVGVCTKDAEWTTIQLEYGRRFNVYSSGNYKWTYSPSVTLTQITENEEAGDQTDMNIALNLLKFDVWF